ncbi:phosphatidylinositol-specific phospholipase C/glycerophosphodiester phosphodiesterase family protein [Sunxiuqinia sp. A32]|uniref:phosphatidylinositol-specific phospholipase C/glycerophosphodiester phosphodiesterase family protein n=1 Tax=Sunxiuqinia sp. A32 TaxID=3461496 RepID=UPI004045D45F
MISKFVFNFFLLTCFFIQTSVAQYSTLNAHSHNDYEQLSPFTLAYENHFGSIEADIWEVNGDLYVAHDRDKINPERSLDGLYIEPIVEKFKANNGKAWADHEGSFQLLIDLKNEFKPTLALLVEKLAEYPEVFDPSVNKNAVKIVISGNRPEPDEFKLYPSFIFFDGEFSKTYTKDQQKRIPLFSDNFKKYSQWNGKGTIPDSDMEKLSQAIDSVHGLGLKIRFWNAPDFPNSWETFTQLKVDYINTDHIAKLADYLNQN